MAMSLVGLLPVGGVAQKEGSKSYAYG